MMTLERLAATSHAEIFALVEIVFVAKLMFLNKLWLLSRKMKIFVAASFSCSSSNDSFTASKKE
ncbi:hypothetical protein NXX09_09925 [Bacteroides uniformis]|nr:hypothetical protein [Bacteroides uniformis]